MDLRLSISIVACLSLFYVASTVAKAQVSPPQISVRIDETRLITLRGNTLPEANISNDRGIVPDSLQLKRLQLALRRPDVQERRLQKLIRDLHDYASPAYHHWLSAGEYGARFGVAPRDINKITAWLISHGFHILDVPRNRMRIDFSGTAGEVREAFHTEIHRLDVDGREHFANMSDPQVPAALAPAVAGIVSLNDFRPTEEYRGGTNCQPFTNPSGNGWIPTNQCQWITPGDLWAIYGFPANQGNLGSGQTIVLMEDGVPWSDSSHPVSTDWCNFRHTFIDVVHTCTTSLFSVVNPEGCQQPTAQSDEVSIDPEWATAAAPGANIVVATCADQGTGSPGFLIALQNYLNEGGSGQFISLSFGECELRLGTSGNALWNETYTQAVVRGFSVFVSAGDAGAAHCDKGGEYASQGIAVNGFASSPLVVAVGGTTFADIADDGVQTCTDWTDTFWNCSNNANYVSAVGYIPEVPWNQSCGNVLLLPFYGFGRTYGQTGFCNSSPTFANHAFENVGAGGGGPSLCATSNNMMCEAGYAKQAWQQIVGNPNDSVRDIPDVSIVAGGTEWGHELVYCDTWKTSGAVACSIGPSSWSDGEGTSFSAPIFAGIQAAINASIDSTGANLPADYYTLANVEYGSFGNMSCASTAIANGQSAPCWFYDVSYLNDPGDATNDVPCGGGSPPDCYLDGAAIGVLSKPSSSYAPAYKSTIGWDFTTGIGTPNVQNLITRWCAIIPSECGTPRRPKRLSYGSMR